MTPQKIFELQPYRNLKWNPKRNRGETVTNWQWKPKQTLKKIQMKP